MKKTIKTVLLFISVLCMSVASAFAAGEGLVFLTEDTSSGGESWVKNLLISLLIGAVIAGIAVGVMASKHKSVRWKNNASDYEKEGSFDLQLSDDVFSHTSTSKRRKSK